MAKDFSAKQIRVSQLIASGAISGTHASIAIYSASDASNLQGGYSATSMFKGVGDDVFLFVSGTVDGKGRTGTTHPGNITLFGGDVVVSGTFYTEKLVTEIDATSTGSLSISGSAYIQHGLFVSGADGRNMHILAPSLFDGNMHISGNVSDFALTGTIKNTASKIVESSVATEIETDAGSLTLDGKTGVNLQANGTTVLSVGPAGTYLSSSVSDFALTGTIKNSASKVIESSVATEIETDAGALTLDGKTGVSLQANGTTILSVGPAGTYLSSSVSDFALTGTIKNSAAKVIESSVATEIETDAGALTLDGKTGINLQEDGTTVIAIDDQRNVSIGVGATKGLYLSSSLSDFALTGTIKNSASKVIESSVATEIETAAGALTLDGRTGVILQTSGSMLMSVGSGSIYISGSVSDFALSGTIKNTAAKVIESAVATEIETTAGSLTIDGKTGINLQANGTTVLSVGPAGTYLSSSVSDFALTGTIKNSASKVIESSVATEIETSAGLLTLDGKSGISLQSNGSPYISIDSTGNTTFLGPLYVSGAIGKDGSNIHLSGTVSDFSLTGTIKNSSSKVIESSAATKIETTAGELTLDANSGIKIQTSGSDILTTSAAGIYLSGTVSDYSLSGTIKTSASKIIEASAGAEIETAAGFLTLDGKSGVRLQTGGADILGTGNDSIYLSGTVSDFSLTGTIKNSTSKVIESSIATEIETSAGSLTLDGFSGVDVQISGSSYITVNTGAIVIGAGRDPGVIPPALYVSGAIQSNLHVSGALFANNISGSLTSLANGSEYIVAGSGVSVSTGSTGQLTISASGVESFKTISISGQSDVVAEQTGDTLTLVAGNNTVITTDASTDTITIQALQGGGSSTVFNDRNHKATSTGSLSIAGPGLGLIYDTTDVGSDVFFFVSGTAGSRNTSNTGSAVFGGDVIVSGTFYAEKIVAEIDATSTGSLSISGSAYIQQGLLVSGAHGRNMHILAPSLFDGNMHISGSVSDFALSGTIKNSASKVIESSVATEIETTAGVLTLDGKTGVNLQTNGTTILSVGPAGTYLSGNVSDITLTGSIKGTQTHISADSIKVDNSMYLSGSVFADKLSGSLTTLANGSEYLIAGTNVTINTGSSGALTISATGGTPAGSDTQVQFNDGGAFAGDSGLVFNKTSNLLTVAKLATTDNAHFSGSVSDFNLTGTIKNSASKVIESSVATEIESTGSLTLDGASSVALQANGTTILSVGPAGTYLSGNVSDITLTGSIKGTQTHISSDSVLISNNLYLSGTVSEMLITGTLDVDGVLTADGGVKVDNITIDGTEIDLSSGNLTLDVAGNIILDADGGTITLKDDGTYGLNIFQGNSGDWTFESLSQNKDIVFNVRDGGTVRDILRMTGVTRPSVIINEDGDQQIDFRVESKNSTHMLYVNGYDDRVGIGIASTGAPYGRLMVEMSASNPSMPENTLNDFTLVLKNRVVGIDEFAGIAFDVSSEIDIDAIGAAIRAERDSSAGTTTTKRDTNLTFATNTDDDADLTERMRITHDGNVFVGEPFAPGTDSIFYVTGVVGSQGSAVKGTSVLGGDAIVSGTFRATHQVATGALPPTYTFVASASGEVLIGAPRITGDDTILYVTGVIGSQGSAGLRGTTVLGGDAVISGTLRVGPTGSSAGTLSTAAIFNGDVLPGSHNVYNIGSDATRWANVYTADLHLKNERGNWTIVEEEDYLCVVNNKSGKRFKMMLEEIEE